MTFFVIIRFDLAKTMWSADPDERPTFVELQSVIKKMMANTEPDDYSYTLAPRTSPMSDGPLPDGYLQPINDDPERESKLYADSIEQFEPDIY